MRRKILIIIFSILCVCFVSACDCNKEKGPVPNAELDEYNQIVSQMKDAFSQVDNQAGKQTDNTESAQVKAGASNLSTYAMTFSNVIEQQDEMSQMFTLMESDLSKKESQDMDYYAYGIDFSTMTARIAGYGANHFFDASTFYGLNILMDYGSDTLINASVKKDGDIIKTYLYTQYETTFDGLQKEYNYTEIKFASQTDFKLVVIDYTYDEQNNLVSNTMIYATSQKEFFMISGMADETESAFVFFDRGENYSAYEINGKNSSVINSLFSIMQEKFALSQEDKDLIKGLYQNEQHSITFAQVMEAKKDLGIIIDMENGDVEPPVGFVSNKNAEDLVGRKTLQEFWDDEKSVVVDGEGKKLTIPNEFKYLSGSIRFHADIDTLIIPSSIEGVVIYNSLWDYSKMDDTLCFFEPILETNSGMWRDWGGTLVADLNKFNDYQPGLERPFKKYILLDENGQPTTQTKAFMLDEMGNLWIKDSKGQPIYLWGFTSEPKSDVDTWNIPASKIVKKDTNSVLVSPFYCEGFFEAMKNVGKLDDYIKQFKNINIEMFYVGERLDNLGYYEAGWYLPNTSFLRSWWTPEGIQGAKWDLENLTINNVADNAKIDLTELFCSTVSHADSPTGEPMTVCQVEIDEVILNGDFQTITLINGYADYESMGGNGEPNGDGSYNVVDGNRPIKATHAIGDEIKLNGRENARFSWESEIYGQKTFEYVSGYTNIPRYFDIEKIVIDNEVSEVGIHESLFEFGGLSLPADRKLTIEFENIAGIDYDMFYIKDLMEGDSNRVEKIIFNVTEARMQKIVADLEGNPYASWLVDIINSNRYIVEYGQPLPGEEEFLNNFDVGAHGIVSLKAQSNISEIIIDDDYLEFIKKLTAKDLENINLSLYGNGENDIKIKLDVSKEYYNENGQTLPRIDGGKIIELSEKMLEYDNLTVILDRLMQASDAKLIINGTKQDLVDCFGSLGNEYLNKLLFTDGNNYIEIAFLNEYGAVIEKLQNNLNGKTMTYNDGRIEIKITYDEGWNHIFSFKDLQNPTHSMENSTSNRCEGQNWSASVSLVPNGYDESEYIERDGENEYIRLIKVPKYELSILYADEYNDEGYPIFAYGSDTGPQYILFSLLNPPQNITIS